VLRSTRRSSPGQVEGVEGEHARRDRERRGLSAQGAERDRRAPDLRAQKRIGALQRRLEQHGAADHVNEAPEGVQDRANPK
jgi:hypothetical protein